MPEQASAVVGGHAEPSAEATGSIPPAQAAGPDSTARIELAVAANATRTEPAPEAAAAAETRPVPPAPAEPGQAAEAEAGAEEPHGLGWLLSMSGLGAVNPEPGPPEPDPSAQFSDVPAADTDTPVNDTAPIGGTPTGPPPTNETPATDASPSEAASSSAPVSAAPISAAPISAAPISAAPVSSQPVSGAAPKQDWFVPITETRLVIPEVTGDSRPPLQEQSTTSPPAPEAAEPTAAEPDSGLAEAGPAQVETSIEPVPAPDEADDAPAEAAAPELSDPADAEIIDAEVLDPEPTTTATHVAADVVDADVVDAEVLDPEEATTAETHTEDRDTDPTETAPAESPAPETDAPQPIQAEAAAEDEPGAPLTQHRYQPARPEPTTPSRESAHPRTENAALRAPSMQLPALSVPPPPQPVLEPERRRPDPEQILATYPWKIDPITLRETVEDPEPMLAVWDQLTDRLEYAERDAVRGRLLGLRAVVSRVLGDVGRALADAREALRHAQATGDLRQILIMRARLAHVQQWRGDFAEADRLFEEANSVELPDRLRAELHALAGRSAYEQGRYLEACNHFEAALELRRVEDPDLVTRTETALDAVMARVREAGWGPYPRSREEILQQSRPPHPALDYTSGWHGYADSDGEVIIPERYAEAQPFHEGVAWVRRPGTAAWELIDETGALVIDPSSGYVQVGRFSGGLAWVSREPAGGWFAIDWHNRVIVPGGFEDVRPFRHGLAVVSRGGWGAIDRHGRVVVQLRYQRFATELTAGGPVEGFTAEGLAVVDVGDRLGVVDRSGRSLLAPVYSRLLIHPVAFLVGDRDGRWGALDRDGDTIVEVNRVRPGDVVDEIARLRSGTRPVL